jgi:small-conductance mechanosensitive channel
MRIMTIYYLIFAIGFFVILRFISRLLNSIPASKNIHKLLLRIFPLVEFAVWMALGIWIMNNIFSDSPYYSTIISATIGIIALIIGWYFLRDFISGIILKTEIAFEVNQRIKIPQAEGLLKKMGYRTIEIETDKGDIVKIPYTQLASNVINLQNTDSIMQGHETHIHIDAKLPIQDVKERIEKCILVLPWSSINKLPHINITEQNDTFNTFSIQFYAISNKHAAYISQQIKSCFENESIVLKREL